MTLRAGLFVSGSAGGVTQPQDARLAQAGGLTGVGVVAGGAVTGSTSGPNMKYNIAAGSFVTARGNVATDGVYEFANDATLLVDSGAPAPSSGTRWDLVWVRHLNAYGSDGFADASSLPVPGVTVGTAGASPTKPYASVPAGALVLAEVSVGTNIANASLASITMVAAAAGARLPKAAGSTVYPATPAVGDVVDDATLGLMRWNGSAWQKIGRGADPWTNITPGASWASGASPDNPQACVVNGVVYWHGLIQTTSGNFATNSTLALISSGGIPSKFRPPFKINVPLSSSNPANDVRGIIDIDGSMTIITGATTGAYVDMAGFSGRYPSSG